MNLLECADGSTDTKSKTNKKCGTPYSLGTCLKAEHPIYCGPALLRNILLTMDLLHCGTSPPQKTQLILDMPYRRTPYSPWTFPTVEQLTALLIMDLPHRGTSYSPWICPTLEHPTQPGPAHLEKIQRIWEALNLSTCAKSKSGNSKKNNKKHMFACWAREGQGCTLLQQ